VGHTSRSSDLLCMEACQTRVSQFGLKTGGDAMACDTHGTIVEVASRSSRRWTGRYDGLRQTLLPLLYHFCSIRP
jgi:hypothetical protein